MDRTEDSRDKACRPMVVVTISIRSSEVSVPSLSLDAPRIVIGRSRSSDVRVPDPSVSGRHATIRQRGAEYLLLDEGSTNGTFIDGRKLSPGSPVLLGRKTSVRVGRVWLEITLEQAAPSNNPAKLTRDIALELIAGAMEASGNPCAPRLVVRSGPASGAELVLAELKRVYTVGRGSDSDLDLRDDDVSRLHLEVTRRGGDVLIRDAGSKNGASLDGVALVARKPVAFQLGQVLELGRSRVELVDPLSETLKQLEAEPDEVMADEEHVASRSPEDNPPPQAPGRELEPARGESGGDAAPIALAITSPPKNRPKSNLPGGWSLTDILVGVLSVIVLAASIAGIVWLFGS